MSRFLVFVFQCAAALLRRHLDPDKQKQLLLVPEFGTFGGTRTYFLDLLKYYKARRISFSVLIFPQLADDQVRSAIRAAGGTLIVTKERSRRLGSIRFVRFFYRLYCEMSELAYAMRFVHPSPIVATTGPYLQLAVFLMPVPVMYIIHTYVDRPLDVFSRAMLAVRVRGQKKIVTVTDFCRRAVIEYAVGSSRADDVVVAYPSTDTRDFVPNRRSGPTLQVLTLGHVAWTKNPETWLKVAYRVSDRIGRDRITFQWAGGGHLTDESLHQFRAEVKHLGYTNIHFLGFRSDVEALYSGTDIYFQPSRVENACLSVIDAMKWGIPCVTSNAGGLPELVERCGFMSDPDDVDGLAGHIVRLAADPSLRDETGEKSRGVFLERFTQEIWYQRLDELHGQAR